MDEFSDVEPTILTTDLCDLYCFLLSPLLFLMFEDSSMRYSDYMYSQIKQQSQQQLLVGFDSFFHETNINQAKYIILFLFVFIIIITCKIMSISCNLACNK